jgi:hypothetical protein
MGAAQVEAFLTHLAAHENVAASTQNVAFNALLFFSCTARFSNVLSPTFLA